MNYLDSVRTVNAYSRAIGSGADKNALLYRPITNIPQELIDERTSEFKKDEVITGSIIFLSYAILYHTITQETFDLHLSILKSIDFFVEDSIYNDVIQCCKTSKRETIFNKKTVEIAKKKVAEYLDGITLLIEHPYRYDEVTQMIDSIIDKKAKLFLPIEQGKSDILSLIDEYCSYVYSVAGLDYGESEYLCYQHPKQLKKMLNSQEHRELLLPYEDIIMSMNT